MSEESQKIDYSDWSQENLIERVKSLELALIEKTLSLQTLSASSVPQRPEKRSWKKPRTERVFDPSKYSTRLIALKLSYLGKRYNGFEHHANQATPLPTVEEELWKALNKARLIFPQKGTDPLRPGEVNWEGTGYSKCGRTDRGVSAFGQVIGIRVRSNRPLGKRKESKNDGNETTVNETEHKGDGGFNTYPRENGIETASPPLAPSRNQQEPEPQTHEDLRLDMEEFEEALNFDPIEDEINYPALLNRLLPPDIRILAWCPSPPLDFSARFSCRERQYRYFFTQPAFPPMPHSLDSPLSPINGTLKDGEQGPRKMKDGWLDIEAMRTAAKYFEGLHDFRNFCKVDGGKQIENFERRIFKADIEEVDDDTSSLAYLNNPGFLPDGMSVGNPKVYTFTLHGSAFLWHQVRCMVSVLFLVAQGLEKPEVVQELLDVGTNPRRPLYEMATDTPLVLWDCIFPHEDDPDRKDALEWIYLGSGRRPNAGEAKYGSDGLMENLWSVWRGHKIDEILASTLIGVVAQQGEKLGEGLAKDTEIRPSRSQKVFHGGDAPRLQGLYTPVMKKPVMGSVEDINERYAVRKGFESSSDLKVQGFRRLGTKDSRRESGRK